MEFIASAALWARFSFEIVLIAHDPLLSGTRKPAVTAKIIDHPFYQAILAP
jgi:hypothetical protein